MRAVLDHIEDIALGIKTFWFKPETHPDHNPGQYLRWYLPHENPDDRGERRWFTVSASPTEAPLISFTTKFAAEKRSSFKTKLLTLKPGEAMEFTGPFGDFVLLKDENIPLIFVAGGIGVTPFRSIIKYLIDSKQKRQIHLLYGANSLEEVAFRDLLESYEMKFDLILSTPPLGWTGKSGRLDAAKILEIIGGFSKQLFYLSGPEPMIEALAQDLKTKNVLQTSIVTDFFPGYSDI